MCFPVSLLPWALFFLLLKPRCTRYIPGIAPPGLKQPAVSRLKCTYQSRLVHTFRQSSLQTLYLADVVQRSVLRVMNVLDPMSTYLQELTISATMLAGAWPLLPLAFLRNFVGLQHLVNTKVYKAKTSCSLS